MPLISVCIPAYNRPEVLPALLDSILGQDFDDYEVVICEDKSPMRLDIAGVVANYSRKFPGRIAYFENEKNLGYDANLRNLFSMATGQYCLFMGNDDLMCPGALSTVAAALGRHPNLGVVLRSYASFDGTPDNIAQVFRYFDKEIFFPAGAETIATIYRRSVVIPGMVIHREAALELTTDRFDGSLLYQLYLVANILVTKNAVFLPDILVLYRNGGIPDFGNSEKEKGRFVPTEQTPASSVYFMQGMLEIAAYTEKARGVSIYRPILGDIGNYSYPILAIQARRPFWVFVKYGFALAKLGLWSYPLFHLYFWALLIVGPTQLDKLIIYLKSRIGHTPRLGAAANR
jgi:glycosyltransferase involved in cell wall biosynthesis